MITTHTGNGSNVLKPTFQCGTFILLFISMTYSSLNADAQSAGDVSGAMVIQAKIVSAGQQSDAIKQFETVNLNSGLEVDAKSSSGKSELPHNVGLSVKERTISYFAVVSGNASEAIWSDTKDGGLGVIDMSNEKMDITINSGVSVSFDIPMISLVNLTIEQGSTLSLGTTQLYLIENLTCNGTIASELSEVVFDGVIEQHIFGSSSITLYNVTSNNAVRVCIDNPGLEMINLLQVNAGEFKTNGKLTLLSTAERTAMIGPLQGLAVLKNNVTVQRYYQSLAQNWISLCSPVQGTTVADWNDDIITTGFKGADYPTYSINNIRYYNEPEEGEMNNGLKGIAQANTPITNKRGYLVYANPGAMIIDVDGAIFKGNQTLPVTYTPTEDPDGDGWNLVANPYPCAIDWDSPAWTKSNLIDAVYLWDAETSQYASYIDGVGNNGGSALIPSSEAFFVMANGPTPVLNISENAKNTSGIPLKEAHAEKDILRLSIHHVRSMDETTIAWKEGATAAYDMHTDAMKLKSPADVPYLSTVSDDGVDLSVNAIDRGLQKHTIAFNVEVPEDAVYTFQWNGVPDFTDGSCVVFRDALTQLSYALNEFDHVNIELTKGGHLGRFFLEVGVPALREVTEPSCYGFADGTASIQGEGEGPWSVIWTDATGKVIRQVENVYEQDVITRLSAGYYEVVIEDNGYCADTHAGLVVTEPEKLEITTSSSPESCPQNSDGHATIDVKGGIEPISIAWEGGQTGPYLNDVHAGAYLVIVRDGSGCSATEVVEVPSGTELESSFETFGGVFELNNGAVLIDFYNTSISGEEFIWNFGDGTVLKMSENPSHMYNKIGEYEVMLETSDEDCVSLETRTIKITNMGESSVELSEQINGILTDNGIQLNFSLDHPRTLRLCAWTVLGQQLIEPRIGEFYHETIQLGERRYSLGSLIEIIDESTGERAVLRF